MSLQAALSLKRNSAIVDNPTVARSLTVSIISITIAYHSYRLYQETKQEQVEINRHITSICKILKKDILSTIEAEKQLRKLQENPHLFPTCITTKTKKEE